MVYSVFITTAGVVEDATRESLALDGCGTGCPELFTVAEDGTCPADVLMTELLMVAGAAEVLMISALLNVEPR